MKTLKPRRYFAALAALLGSVLPAVAGAQTVPAVSGWALDRYEPTTTGDVFFMSEHPWYSSTRVFSVGIVADYAANPLVLRQEFAAADGSTTTTTTNIVSGQFVGHLGAAVSFLDRVGLNVSLPLSFYQGGTASPAGTGTLGPASGVGVGDLRFGARLRIAGQSDRDPISLHLGVNLWAPIGSRSSNTGDENVRFEPRLTLAGRASIIRWSAGAAFQLRGSLDAVNLAIGNELRFNAALGFVALDDNLTIGPEAYVFSAVRDLPAGRGQGSAAFQTGQWGGELMLGAHYLAGDTILIGLGGGVGLERGYGVPAGRGLFTLAYAPVTRVVEQPPSDRDGDGVLDVDDLCPDTPQGPHPDPARRGCPLLDTDGDGVFDPDDICVTVPQGEHPDPTRRGCPLPDSDGDGVFDPQDQCVTTPMGEHPDPDRLGCPDGDRDHDSILDHADVCPDVHRGPFPDPARIGCPLADRDHDTVPDATDACPDVPGAPSEIPARNGCPIGGVTITPGRINILTPVFFDTDRDTIKPQSFPILSRVADVLRASPFIRRIRIEGHTDDRGNHDHNVDLSNRRAISVMRWLTEHSVDSTRMEAQGFGPDRAIASNQTVVGRARNRRVEFVILDPAQSENTVTQSAATADPGDIRDSGTRRNRPAPR
ncbi:MAG: porin [Myxococcaceae bacterium]|nr:porin [Myxococcaceae bacterium]